MRRSVALAPSLTAGITGPLASAKGTPLEPIGAALASAIQRRSRASSTSTARCAWSIAAAAAGCGSKAPTCARRAGAAINVSGGDGITYYWPSEQAAHRRQYRDAGRRPADGADLAPPAAQRRTDERHRADRALCGRGSADRTRPGQFRGAARRMDASVDRRLARRAVRRRARDAGCACPIAGRFGPGGALVFGARLHRRTLHRAQIGGLRLGPTRLPLVPDRGGDPQPPRRRPGPVRRLATRNVRARGRLGNSPFALSAAQARMLGQREFEASGLALRLGKADAPVLINASTPARDLLGRRDFGDLRGRRGQRSAGSRCNLTDAAGKWRFYKARWRSTAG